MRILPAILVIAIAAAPCAAAEKKLTTDEIQSAFAGNSVHGLWGDTEYYSFFDARGLTTYTTRQGTDRGHWRAKNDQYCSVWQMGGESCYDILQDGDKIIWVLPSSGKRYESTLMPGDAPAVFQ
ncbi:MAG: hypothetical protein ACKVOI_11935 [Dongiaceae bacterium]